MPMNGFISNSMLTRGGATPKVVGKVGEIVKEKVVEPLAKRTVKFMVVDDEDGKGVGNVRILGSEMLVNVVNKPAEKWDTNSSGVAEVSFYRGTTIVISGVIPNVEKGNSNPAIISPTFNKTIVVGVGTGVQEVKIPVKMLITIGLGINLINSFPEISLPPTAIPRIEIKDASNKIVADFPIPIGRVGGWQFKVGRSYTITPYLPSFNISGKSFGPYYGTSKSDIFDFNDIGASRQFDIKFGDEFKSLVSKGAAILVSFLMDIFGKSGVKLPGSQIAPGTVPLITIFNKDVQIGTVAPGSSISLEPGTYYAQGSASVSMPGGGVQTGKSDKQSFTVKEGMDPVLVKLSFKDVDLISYALSKINIGALLIKVGTFDTTRSIDPTKENFNYPNIPTNFPNYKSYAGYRSGTNMVVDYGVNISGVDNSYGMMAKPNTIVDLPSGKYTSHGYVILILPNGQQKTIKGKEIVFNVESGKAGKIEPGTIDSGVDLKKLDQYDGIKLPVENIPGQFIVTIYGAPHKDDENKALEPSFPLLEVYGVTPVEVKQNFNGYKVVWPMSGILYINDNYKGQGSVITTPMEKNVKFKYKIVKSSYDAYEASAIIPNSDTPVLNVDVVLRRRDPIKASSVPDKPGTPDLKKPENYANISGMVISGLTATPIDKATVRMVPYMIVSENIQGKESEYSSQKISTTTPSTIKELSGVPKTLSLGSGLGFNTWTQHLSVVNRGGASFGVVPADGAIMDKTREIMATTDTKGSFEFKKVKLKSEADKYKLSINAPGYEVLVTDVVIGGVSTVVGNEVIPQMNSLPTFIMKKSGGSVPGTPGTPPSKEPDTGTVNIDITDEDGNPISFVAVTYGGTLLGYTDDSGKLSLNMLSGRYSLTVYKAGYKQKSLQANVSTNETRDISTSLIKEAIGDGGGTTPEQPPQYQQPPSDINISITSPGTGGIERYEREVVQAPQQPQQPGFDFVGFLLAPFEAMKKIVEQMPPPPGLQR